MKQFHRDLREQLRRHFGSEWDSTEALAKFVGDVDVVYRQRDEEHEALAGALEESARDLLLANAEMRAIIGALPDEFLHVEVGGRILEYRQGIGRNKFLRSIDPEDRDLFGIVDETVGSRLREAITKLDESGRVATFEVVRQSEDLPEQYFEVRVLPVVTDRVVVLVRDISERKRTEQHVAHLAYHDPLTNLPNRTLFHDRLELCLAMAKRHGHMVAVMFLDLDRFKHVNDTFGHRAGDELLVEVTRRLQRSVRETDTLTNDSGPPVTVARVGGDEFTVILSEVHDVQAVARIAARMLAAVAAPVVVDGKSINTTASMGIALFPIDGTSIDALVKNADTAMYHAKERGRNNYQLFTDSMNSAALERLFLENGLRRSIERDELAVVYQPQRLAGGGLRGFEALVRWDHPELGAIAPNRFIPIAEESELIHEVGAWVLNDVCRQVRAWTDAGLDPGRVFFNLSARQLHGEGLAETIRLTIERHGIDAAHLGVEVTEVAIMSDIDSATRVLARIRALGIEVSIDDFGQGLSSLSYLKTFPVDVLKIDQAFVRDLTPEEGSAGLAGAIIALGHALDLCVVAEGVEHGGHAEFLVEHDCDVLQGYFLSPPLSVDQATAHLVEADQLKVRVPSA